MMKKMAFKTPIQRSKSRNFIPKVWCKERMHQEKNLTKLGSNMLWDLPSFCAIPGNLNKMVEIKHLIVVTGNAYNHASLRANGHSIFFSSPSHPS
jgi:hypothetical protein